MSITDADINRVIGDISTKKRAKVSANGFKVMENELTALFSFFIATSPDLESALTAIGLALYEEKEFLSGDGAYLDQAFELAEAAIVQHKTTNKRKR